MYIVVEIEAEDNPLGLPVGTRTAFFGVQDCSVIPGGVRLYWPGGSALEAHETVTPGSLVSAADEAVMNQDTLIDYITEHSYADRAVLVLTNQHPETGLKRTVDTLKAELGTRDGKQTLGLKDEVLVIEGDDTVDISSSKFFVTGLPENN